MPKRKLDDLLKRRETLSTTQPVKQISKPTGQNGTKTINAPRSQSYHDRAQKRVKRIKRISGPVDVSRELSSLEFSTSDNKGLPKLPSNTTISKRPINHGPIASRFAGANVPKVVYISRKTPVISAVKRVKQFLREIEKRAMQSLGVDGVLNRAASGKNGDRELQVKLGQVSDKLERDKEEVLIKASGRAVEQALRIGEWFRNREDEMSCNVEVRTGSVSVIDDIVELDPNDQAAGAEDVHEEDENIAMQDDSTSLEVGDTTMELLKNLEGDGQSAAAVPTEKRATGALDNSEEQARDPVTRPKRQRKRSKKKEYDQDDLPEARLRWVKTVEVAVSLQA